MTKKLANPTYGFDFSKYYLQNKGKLTVIGTRFYKNKPRPKRRLVVKCECGTTKEIYVQVFNDDATVSCGCWQKTKASLSGKFNLKHGHSHSVDGLKNTRIYTQWIKIKGCCFAGWRKGFHYVCHEYDKKWENFEGFFEDFGHIEDNQTISRINRHLPWSKENCLIRERIR